MYSIHEIDKKKIVRQSEHHPSLIIIFIVNIAIFTFLPKIAPNIKIFAFLPFLIVTSLKKTLHVALWANIIIGLYIDLLSRRFPFGTISLNHFLTSLFFCHYKRSFSMDSIFSATMCGALFSFLYSIFYFLLLALMDIHLSLSFSTILTDFICFPMLDGFYFFTSISLINSLQKEYKTAS